MITIDGLWREFWSLGFEQTVSVLGDTASIFIAAGTMVVAYWAFNAQKKWEERQYRISVAQKYEQNYYMLVEALELVERQGRRINRTEPQQERYKNGTQDQVLNLLVRAKGHADMFLDPKIHALLGKKYDFAEEAARIEYYLPADGSHNDNVDKHTEAIDGLLQRDFKDLYQSYLNVSQ